MIADLWVGVCVCESAMCALARLARKGQLSHAYSLAHTAQTVK